MSDGSFGRKTQPKEPPIQLEEISKVEKKKNKTPKKDKKENKLIIEVEKKEDG